MDFFELVFQLGFTALALYFAAVRFRARMPLFGQAMLGTAVFELVFSLKGMDLPSYLCAAVFVWLYMESLKVLHERGLDDGSLS